MATAVLRLGTRRSLLALAQSSWVAREVEKMNPGVRVELVGIDTRGDHIQDIPLSQLDGKEFFVAELDQALKKGTVDFCVHSLKDLALSRPPEFQLAAIPAREDPRDVILFHPRVGDRLKSGLSVRIGTSSPRRLENLPAFLQGALPTVSKHSPKTSFIEIRGNVNTRLARLYADPSSERQLDGVVLALAGLIRLWRDQAGQSELAKLLKELRWMLMPLTLNPTAPGQGALAIECRKDDPQTFELLRKLHDPITEKATSQERIILAGWGGGCHQKLGATQIEHPTLKSIMWVAGRKPDHTRIQETVFPLSKKPLDGKCWNGAQWRARGTQRKIPITPTSALNDQCVFVTHSRAWPESVNAKNARIWTSGTDSWIRLARQGVWVEGCAEGLGFDWIQNILSQPVLKLKELRDWKILTHVQGLESWTQKVHPENILVTYEVAAGGEPEEALAELTGANEVFISSPSQYERVKSYIHAGANISCGPGGTDAFFKSLHLSATCFPSAQSWKEWLEKNQKVKN